MPLLNRFDAILEQFCTTYGLDKGPQCREFGLELLLNHKAAGHTDAKDSWDTDQLIQLGYSSDGDRRLIEAVLNFSRMLLEHCGNRSIYASSERLNDLLNTTSLSTLIVTLRVGSELAQRYQASVKRVGNVSKHLGAALLTNHYNIDLGRVQHLSLPFVRTPVVCLSNPASPQTPASSKGKGKAASGVNPKSSAAAHASDLTSIVDPDATDWACWGDIKLFYYPQANEQGQNSGAEQGQSTVLASPTPLRRTPTTGPPPQTPKARHSSGEDSSPFGHQSFSWADQNTSSGPKLLEFPGSVVSSSSIYDLMKRFPDDMPAPSRYELFHRFRVAKALTGALEERHQLLAIRFLAITNLAYIHTESNFLEKVLRHDAEETRKFQLVYQLAELVHPPTDGKNEVPLWLQSIALTLLEAISGFQAKSQDVLSALNANMNHGILLYIIRKAVAGMKEDDSNDEGIQVTDIDEWRSNLFSLTLHLSMATRVGSEMVSAGLMDILVDMLNIRSPVAQRHHSMVLAFLDGLIWTYQNAFTAFFNANGLESIANLVVATIRTARELQLAGHGIGADQHSSMVDYEIPFYEQQTLKWILKFVHHLMSNSYSYNGNTDRLLRNLSEKSDLLAGLREIIKDKKEFGSVVWTNTVTILSDFINNDPTSFAAISESGMIASYLEAVTGNPLPVNGSTETNTGEPEVKDPASPDISSEVYSLDQDDRPHPPPEETIQSQKAELEHLASSILPTSEAINVIPHVLNSISLNHAGMKMVVTSRALDSFFHIFESPKHVKCMETDESLANHVGGSFDELARHHPPLRPSISNAVIDMVARVRYLGIKKAKNDGLGVQLFINDTDGNLNLVKDDGSIRKSESQSTEGQSEDCDGKGDVDMSGADARHCEKLGQSSNESLPKTQTESFIPYVYALASFLTAYLSNYGLKTNFVDKGGIELLLDICQSPSLTEAYTESVACRTLNSVVAQLVDHAPMRGLPNVLKRAQLAVDALQPLASRQDDAPSCFAPFLTPHLEYPLSHSEGQAVKNGSRLLRALLNAQTFFKILSECFLTSRSNTLQFYPVNMYDYYLNLIQATGPILRGVLTEEAAQLAIVPQQWSFQKHPSENGDHENKSDGDPDDTSMPSLLSGAVSWKSQMGTDKSLFDSKEDDKSSTRYRNFKVIGLLLHPMKQSTFPLFQSIGKALLPRRENNHGDNFPRSRHLEIATALANTVVRHLNPSVKVPNASTKQFHYWIIMLHIVHEMLVEHGK